MQCPYPLCLVQELRVQRRAWRRALADHVEKLDEEARKSNVFPEFLQDALQDFWVFGLHVHDAERFRTPHVHSVHPVLALFVLIAVAVLLWLLEENPT